MVDFAWIASWCWGLSLILLTIAGHAFGVVVIGREIQRRKVGSLVQLAFRYPILLPMTLVGAVGLLLAIMHGIEAVLWASVYVWLGAFTTFKDAMLYSVDSMATRGASGLLLKSHWLMMGALEASDGMLLFGISTAFVFTVIQEVMALMRENKRSEAF